MTNSEQGVTLYYARVDGDVEKVSTDYQDIHDWVNEVAPDAFGPDAVIETCVKIVAF